MHFAPAGSVETIITTMDQLSLHIEYLLLRHDCVIVPGFGAFINVHKSASVDASTGIIMPGTREVRFNGALTHDDGLLANSFARRGNIGFAEGREMLRRETESLRASLETDGEATLGRLGILSLDQEGHISFRPMRDAAALVRELGYLAAPMVSKTDTTPSSEEEKPIYELSDEEESTIQKETPQRKGRKFDTDRNYYIAINKIFARTAASFLLVVGLLVGFLMPEFGGREERAAVIPTQKVEKMAREKVKDAVADAPKAIPAAEAPEREHLPYHLIVATFHSAKEADNFVALHADSNYHLKVIPSKRTWRVSAQAASTSSELQAVLNDDTFRAEYGNCWIWEERK